MLTITTRYFIIGPSSNDWLLNIIYILLFLFFVTSKKFLFSDGPSYSSSVDYEGTLSDFNMRDRNTKVILNPSLGANVVLGA